MLAISLNYVPLMREKLEATECFFYGTTLSFYGMMVYSHVGSDSPCLTDSSEMKKAPRETQTLRARWL